VLAQVIAREAVLVEVILVDLAVVAFEEEERHSREERARQRLGLKCPHDHFVRVLVPAESGDVVAAVFAVAREQPLDGGARDDVSACRPVRAALQRMHEPRPPEQRVEVLRQLGDA
jgi:hypothetical protein